MHKTLLKNKQTRQTLELLHSMQKQSKCQNRSCQSKGFFMWLQWGLVALFSSVENKQANKLHYIQSEPLTRKHHLKVRASLVKLSSISSF